MDCQFSEFSYGYAATSEAEAIAGQYFARAGAPVFPSLRAEAELGWDVRLDTTVEWSLFLQFKRPEFVSRRHPGSPTWDAASVGKHFRVKVDTDSGQHMRLVELENDLKIGDVLYAAPLFWQAKDFNACYEAGTVLERSLLFGPSEFGIDDGIHYYVVCAATGREVVLSEPREPRTRKTRSSLEVDLERAAQAWHVDRGTAERVTLRGLEEQLLEMRSAPELGTVVEAPFSLELGPIGRVRSAAARLGMGVALMLAVD